MAAILQAFSLLSGQGVATITTGTFDYWTWTANTVPDYASRRPISSVVDQPYGAGYQTPGYLFGALTVSLPATTIRVLRRTDSVNVRPVRNFEHTGFAFKELGYAIAPGWVLTLLFWSA